MSSRSSLPSLSTNPSSNSPSTPTSKLPRSNSAGLDLLASSTRDRGNGTSRPYSRTRGKEAQADDPSSSFSSLNVRLDHPYGIISTSSALLTRSNSSSSGAHSPAAGKNWTRGHQSSRFVERAKEEERAQLSFLAHLLPPSQIPLLPQHQRPVLSHALPTLSFLPFGILLSVEAKRQPQTIGNSAQRLSDASQDRTSRSAYSIWRRPKLDSSRSRWMDEGET